MQLNPSEISELIKQQIEKADLRLQTKTVGTVVRVGDGIVQIHGLDQVMQGEIGYLFAVPYCPTCAVLLGFTL